MRRKKEKKIIVKKIKKGDEVVVLQGKDKGRRGKIKQVFPSQGMVVVEGINKVKKHVKPQGKDQPGGIVEIEKPLAVSKVALFCPHCQRPVRVGFELDKQGRKQRICKKCRGLISEKGGKE